MRAVHTALWFVEMYVTRRFELAAVAETCKLTPEHLARVFAQQTGLPLMAYARKRTLSLAAIALKASPHSVLTIALDHGYGSSEAFARAFKAEFGIAPHQFRQTGNIQALNLTKALSMTKDQNKSMADLIAPRLEKRDAFTVTGLQRHFKFAETAEIPQLWEQANQFIGSIEGEIGSAAYGVCSDFTEDGFNYTCCTETDPAAQNDAPLVTLGIPAQTYLVFTHRGHISGIGATTMAAWDDGIPTSGKKPTNGINFELYDARFDPKTGTGEVEIWIPVEG